MIPIAPARVAIDSISVHFSIAKRKNKTVNERKINCCTLLPPHVPYHIKAVNIPQRARYHPKKEAGVGPATVISLLGSIQIATKVIQKKP